MTVVPGGTGATPLREAANGLFEQTLFPLVKNAIERRATTAVEGSFGSLPSFIACAGAELTHAGGCVLLVVAHFEL